ncbi:anaerobic ribonucleoside-triphosphate reductase [Sporomusa aerivorans]|uniref:anaerobic ribonucleoside-triphosphate reductase n=1 Tax=Sporomusa aerivorans TaxID=204936 RepID=UPI00352A9A52
MIIENTLTIDSVLVNTGGGITEDEIRQIVAEEIELWRAKGKTLGRVELMLDGEEIQVVAHERSPIKRIRRITGYLSTEDRFNPSKQAELGDRRAHL